MNQKTTKSGMPVVKLTAAVKGLLLTSFRTNMVVEVPAGKEFIAYKAAPVQFVNEGGLSGSFGNCKVDGMDIRLPLVAIQSAVPAMK